MQYTTVSPINGRALYRKDQFENDRNKPTIAIEIHAKSAHVINHMKISTFTTLVMIV